MTDDDPWDDDDGPETDESVGPGWILLAILAVAIGVAAIRVTLLP